MITSECNASVLVEKAQRGDRNSLERLVSVVEPKLRAHFLRMTLDVDLAEDFTQETILRMLRGLGKLQNCDSFWGWLYRIAGNLLKDHYRCHKPARFSALEPQNLDECLRDETFRPEMGAFRTEVRTIVRNAISALKEKPRQVLAMRCYDGMSYEQIGSCMGCTDMAARTTFSRAKKSVKRTSRAAAW